MAQVQGFQCDVCPTFSTSKDNNVPSGWMVLRVQVAASVGGGSTFHLCSNRCLKKLGADRERAERETSPNGNGRISEEGRNQLQQNGMQMQHRKGSHADSPNLSCLLCLDEATTPGGN